MFVALLLISALLLTGSLSSFSLGTGSVSAQTGGTATPTDIIVTAAPAGTVTLTPNPVQRTVAAGASVRITFFLSNGTGQSRTYDFTTSLTNLSPSFTPQTITVNANSTVQFDLVLFVPSTSTAGTQNSGTVTATDRSGLSPQFNATSTVIITTAGSTPTSTATNTLTPSPTGTTTPTPTTGPTCVNGSEPQREPGNDINSARLILINTEESHGICSLGDEDWFKFGAIAGKIYTIDITAMDAGLDLAIDVFDQDGNPVTTNDDFYNRTPTAPNPSDVAPRIQSFRAERTGFYYVRVRDITGLGGNNLTYKIIIRAESYGPTPTQIAELCNDQFEPDGLPETASELVPNSVQFSHVLCPRGDADWVRFFGKAGKIYYIYTDTRPYKGTAPVNDPAEPGADTVMYLADRDGVTLLMMSDDIPGSLDSQIRFSPSVDGHYFVQVKNTGDIGNQFIRYDLGLKLCVLNQTPECAREGSTPGGGTGGGGTGGGGTGGGGTTPNPTPVTPSPTSVDFGGTATPTVAGTPSSARGGGREAAMVNGRSEGFVDPAFERVWSRADRPIAEQRTARSWLWGPASLMARAENFSDSSTGLRQVEYFDKARMEINNPNGDTSSPWYVTTGLLVVELVNGQMQVGASAFVPRPPSDAVVAGDTGDPNAPTYASFAGVTARRAEDRTGSFVGETLNRAGQIGDYLGPRRPEAQLAYFAKETGHNVPKVFWDYLNTRGTVYEGGRFRQDALLDWVFTLGYPISEPFWTRVKVGGADRDVLVQLFQRRVLTYSPDNPAGWQVEMGNVGRAYYKWRYNEELPAR
jgi:hypothetical protein